MRIHSFCVVPNTHLIAVSVGKGNNERVFWIGASPETMPEVLDIASNKKNTYSTNQLKYNGFVYVFQASNGLIKIGQTKGMDKRKTALEKNGDSLTLIAFIRAFHYTYYEKFLHIYMTQNGIQAKNEWYESEHIIEHLQYFHNKHADLFGAGDIEYL